MYHSRIIIELVKYTHTYSEQAKNLKPPVYTEIISVIIISVKKDQTIFKAILAPNFSLLGGFIFLFMADHALPQVFADLENNTME